MKRFWTDVTVAQDGAILLDGRPVRTPGRLPLAVPAPALAGAIADEWRGVKGDIDPRAMPLTGMANAAIERITADPAAFAAGLVRYGESDLLCYRAEKPPELVARQAAAWDPVIDWVRGRYDVHVVTTHSIVHRPQSPGTLARLGEVVGGFDAWTLAGLTPVVTLTGSLLLGLALVEGRLDTDAVWAAAQVDEGWQAERWGEDALAAEARAYRRVEFDAAARFLTLSRG